MDMYQCIAFNETVFLAVAIASHIDCDFSQSLISAHIEGQTYTHMYVIVVFTSFLS